MIDAEERLWAGSGNLITGGPYTWHITDLDQRRHFSVTYTPPAPVEDVEATEDICMAQLQKKNVDQLGDGVYGIRFSEPDGPITMSTNQEEDDVTWYVNSHPLAALELPFPVKTVYLESLTEAVFKYWFMENGMFRTWYELNSWSRLPRDHPHIVPFDSVVLNNVTGGIVGFTTLFIPGGTLKDNNATTRPFRLRWFEQLLSVVDDLNYQYGMMHQDIAARNIVIDEEDNLRIFDFNYSIMIDKHYTPHRDDIKGVIFTLYEIITLDEHFRELPHEEQDAEALLQMEWQKHPEVMLDSDVTEFRSVLDAWVTNRKEKEFKPMDSWVQWPWMPKPPLGPVLKYGPNGEVTGKEMKPVQVVIRKHLVQMGEPYWEWERPASYLLGDALQKGDAGKEANMLPVGERLNGVQTDCDSTDICAVP
ncbi:protein kinase-like domain [Pochonia chlamydosporia 170]|uniref:EKC/KEOPS complex subunit BUD32 n=1 Tax=Pochonia chlamydosporia 170 TaxID=1380566 RepID=A0A179FH64_METCM|nr:protein kinase-like domain [Pochonia chlamydosporia 170]OAQ64389.1 protein kinase-like domain [Pochonia chlamydosporia 170]